MSINSLILIFQPLNFIVLCTLDKSNKNLLLALKHTRLITWNEKVWFNCLHKNQYEMIFDLTIQKQLQLSYFIHSTYWWLPREKALEFNEV